MSDDIEDELEAVGDDEEEATRLAYRRVLHRSSVCYELNMLKLRYAFQTIENILCSWLILLCYS